jgi:hypothetical protein
VRVQSAKQLPKKQLDPFRQSVSALQALNSAVATKQAGLAGKRQFAIPIELAGLSDRDRYRKERWENCHANG